MIEHKWNDSLYQSTMFEYLEDSLGYLKEGTYEYKEVEIWGDTTTHKKKESASFQYLKIRDTIFIDFFCREKQKRIQRAMYSLSSEDTISGMLLISSIDSESGRSSLGYSSNYKGDTVISIGAQCYKVHHFVLYNQGWTRDGQKTVAYGNIFLDVKKLIPLKRVWKSYDVESSKVNEYSYVVSLFSISSRPLKFLYKNELSLFLDTKEGWTDNQISSAKELLRQNPDITEIGNKLTIKECIDCILSKFIGERNYYQFCLDYTSELRKFSPWRNRIYGEIS